MVGAVRQLNIEFPPADPVRHAVDDWLHRNAPVIHSWEGEISEEHGLDNWLPAYNRGVYIVGEYSADCEAGCEDCQVTPLGFRTCRPRVKIGIASNMYMRLANLRCGSPHQLEVMALLPFGEDRIRSAERELHSIFAPMRIQNGRKTEWFWNGPAIEDLVCEVVSFGAEYGGVQ
jgi:hypothetical protein